MFHFPSLVQKTILTVWPHANFMLIHKTAPTKSFQDTYFVCKRKLNLLRRDCSKFLSFFKIRLYLSVSSEWYNRKSSNWICHFLQVYNYVDRNWRNNKNKIERIYLKYQPPNELTENFTANFSINSQLPIIIFVLYDFFQTLSFLRNLRYVRFLTKTF